MLRATRSKPNQTKHSKRNINTPVPGFATKNSTSGGGEFGFIYKSNGICSQVSRIQAKRLIVNGEPKSQGQIKRDEKKREKLDALPSIAPNAECSMSREECLGKMFNGTNGPPPSLKLFTNDQGGVNWADKEGEVLNLLLLPRDVALEANGKSNKAVVSALNLLQGEKAAKRSDARSGKSTSGDKHVTFGKKPLRGGPGYGEDSLRSRNPQAAATLNKHCRRMQHVVAKYLPSKFLRGAMSLHKYRRTIATITKGCKLFGAMSAAINYNAVCHTDMDFYYSVHNCYLEGHDPSTASAIICYFCFPTIGIAVGLRPGDVLIFNPQIPHCTCHGPIDADTRIHCSACYMKTAHIGGNDNRLTLSEEEKDWLWMDPQDIK